VSYYVAVDIGCIECGEESAVLGIFTEEAVADAICTKEAAAQMEDWGGQHSFEVFAVDELDKQQARSEEGGGE